MNIFLLKNSKNEIFNAMLDQSISHLLKWSKRTIDALPDNDKKSSGYRDYNEKWFYPRSNSGERINAYLFGENFSQNSSFLDYAKHYADALCDDPTYGIYQGKYEEGVGQVWYWRDCGTYMTNYTMRIPEGMLALYYRTGDKKYEQAALLAGEALLRFQTPIGIISEGWFPPDNTNIEEIKKYVTNYKINSRVGYALKAFAILAKHTNDSRYFDALDKLCDGMLAIQYSDGSLPQEISTIDKGKFLNPAPKGHFIHYVLNGAASALTLFPEHKKLRVFTEKTASYVSDRVANSWGAHYGNIRTICEREVEKDAWTIASGDPISGLIDSSQALAREDFMHSALHLGVSSFANIFDTPDTLDTHGGLKISPDGDNFFNIGGYYHFFTLLGLAKFWELNKNE